MGCALIGKKGYWQLIRVKLSLLWVLKSPGLFIQLHVKGWYCRTRWAQEYFCGYPVLKVAPLYFPVIQSAMAGILTLARKLNN